MARDVKKRAQRRVVGRSRVSPKHQVTIPAAARRSAGLEAGDVVKVEAQGAGRVVLTKVDDLLDHYSGSLDTGGQLRDELEGLREGWK